MLNRVDPSTPSVSLAAEQVEEGVIAYAEALKRLNGGEAELVSRDLDGRERAGDLPREILDAQPVQFVVVERIAEEAVQGGVRRLGELLWGRWRRRWWRRGP